MPDKLDEALGLLNQVMALPEGAYNALVPTNARAFIRGAIGRTTPIDETFFKPAELEALRVAAQRGLADYAKPPRPPAPFGDSLAEMGPAELAAMADYYRQYPDEQYRRPYKNAHITYEHYDRPWTIGNRPQDIFGWMADPSLVAQSTIGSALLSTDKDGNVILTDRYNFDPGHKVGNDLWAKLHRLGEQYIPDGYDVRVNLGKLPPRKDD